MSDPTSPYWLESASGLNAAGNTDSNSSPLPPLPIHSSDYFTNPDYLIPKDGEATIDAQFPPEWQPPTDGVPEAYLQPVTGKMSDVYGTDQHTAHQFSQSFNVDTTSYNHGKQFIDRQPDGQIQSKEWQPPKNEVPEAFFQPVTGRMSDVYGTDQYTAHQFSRSFNVDPTSNNHTKLTFDGQAADPYQSRKWQPPTSGLSEADLQPVTGRLPDVYGADRYTANQFPQSFNAETTSYNHSKQTFDGQAADLYQPTDFQWQTSFTNATYPQAPPTFTTPGYSSLPPQSVAPTFCKPKTSDDIRTQKKPKLKFEQWQLDVLEGQFAVKKHVTRAEKQRLAEQLKLEPIQVLNWFMNRRQIERRRNISQQGEPHSVSSTQESFPVLMNNQHLQSSSNVPYPQYYTSSPSSHNSSWSTQPNFPWFEEQLETPKEHDETILFEEIKQQLNCKLM